MDGIKIPNLKVSWPSITRNEESESQVQITSEVYFENADITKAFEDSGKIKETTQFNERFGEQVSEADNREEALIDYISDAEKELKKDLEKDLDTKFKSLDSLPGYVACEVEVSLYGKDSKDIHGYFNVKIFVDIEMSQINEVLESVFGSLR